MSARICESMNLGAPTGVRTMVVTERECGMWRETEVGTGTFKEAETDQGHHLEDMEAYADSDMRRAAGRD